MVQDSDEWLKTVATFRFGIISDFVIGVRLEYGDKKRLLQEKTSRQYVIPGSSKTTISRTTILSWIKAYQRSGHKIESLYPKTRSDQGTFKSLSPTLRVALKDLVDENRHYTIPIMIKKLRQQKILESSESINRAVVYRFVRKYKLQKPSEDAVDRRRFEATHTNQIWQSDALHGPLIYISGSSRAQKSYLFAIIDDHSRFIIHAQFYTSETFETFKIGLCHAVMQRGLPQKFYVDNGSCYRSDQLDRILASIGVQLCHSRPYKPQGRGKVERWFKNIRDSLLPLLPDSPLPLDVLNQKLNEFVDTYNQTHHSSINMTPYERYSTDLSCIRSAPDRLRDYFRHCEVRKVKKDRTVQVHKRIFEVPTGLIDKTVELHYHPENPEEVEVFLQGISYGKATILNLAMNARGGRDYKERLPPRVELHQSPQPPEIKGGCLFEPTKPLTNEPLS